jgi:hypothetical protein
LERRRFAPGRLPGHAGETNRDHCDRREYLKAVKMLSAYKKDTACPENLMT